MKLKEMLSKLKGGGDKNSPQAAPKPGINDGYRAPGYLLLEESAETQLSLAGNAALAKRGIKSGERPGDSKKPHFML